MLHPPTHSCLKSDAGATRPGKQSPLPHPQYQSQDRKGAGDQPREGGGADFHQSHHQHLRVKKSFVTGTMMAALESGVREGPGESRVWLIPTVITLATVGSAACPGASQTALMWGLDETASISQAYQNGRNNLENLQLGPSHNQSAPLSHLIPQDGSPNKKNEQSWIAEVFKRLNGSALPPDSEPRSNKGTSLYPQAFFPAGSYLHPLTASFGPQNQNQECCCSPL